MALPKLTYEDYKSRLSIQEVLQEAGYHLNRKDGLRYPSYVRLGSDGRRVSGDKFIVSGQGKCCFQPPERKNYNIISFIKEYPHLFADYRIGMSLDRLVNVVCHKLLNQPLEERQTRILDPIKERKPFDISKYEISNDPKQVARFMIPRGISISTQKAFAPYMFISSKQRDDGKKYGNISFPLSIPNKSEIVGLEVRGVPNKDGKSPFKGMAAGSNSAEGMWIACPLEKELPAMDSVGGVSWFESAYDAMAFYQIHEHEFVNNPSLRNKTIFVSTGGTPTEGQIRNMIEATPNASHFLCFDNDVAGLQFREHFHKFAESLGVPKDNIKDFKLLPSYKDWNDALLGKRSEYDFEEAEGEGLALPIRGFRR